VSIHFQSVEMNSVLVAEEMAAYDTPLHRAIHTAEVLSEDLRERDEEVTHLVQKYRDVFRSKEDAEYFAMLPLSVKDRVSVLNRARELCRGDDCKSSK
jgi:hypothetical protein